MPTLFDPTHCNGLLHRIRVLTPDHRPQWGHMTAPQMVCHLHAAFEASLGELAVGPPVGPFSRFPLNWLVIHLLPWPQGKAESPPEFLARAATTWEHDLDTLGRLVERAAARGPRAAWPVSRVFGRISGRSWGVLHWRHVDHHLRQFRA